MSRKPPAPELKKKFRTILRAIDPKTQKLDLVRDTADSAYAAYVYGLVIRAIERVSAYPVTIRSVNNPNTSPAMFVVRGAPGAIYSTAHDYGYVQFVISGRTDVPHELHMGVEYTGFSGHSHEMDISIICQYHADFCRQVSPSRPVLCNPEPWMPVLSIECKFLGGNVDIALARAFAGVLMDFFNFHTHIELYRGGFEGEYPSTTISSARMATNSVSGSVDVFIQGMARNFNHHSLPPMYPQLGFHENLQPTCTSSENDFIDQIVQDLGRLSY